MSRWNVSNDEYNTRSSTGSNDMLPVEVNGKNIFTGFLRHTFAWSRSQGRAAKSEIFGNKGINKSSHGLAFLQGGNIATKERPRRLRPMRAIQLALHLCF